MMITETSSGVVLANGGGKIRRTSFKSRNGSGGGGGGGGGNGGRGYRAVRVTVPSTMVAELASKFNAVVVDAGRDATARDIIKKVNKTLATTKAAAAAGQSGGVRATVEKFESVVEKKQQHGGGGAHQAAVVVRTNSATAEQRPPSSSIVKRRTEQFQLGKKQPSKPKVLAPKPNVANLMRRDERRLLVLKRLSVARDPDARLESVLNATVPPQPSEETERQPPPPEIRPKPNSSFLHGRKRPTDGTATDVGAIYEELQCDVQNNIIMSPSSSSSLPEADGNLYSYDDDTAADHHHYTTIDGGGGGEQNIYDDVVLASAAAAAAQKTRKRPADEDGSYETVQPPPPPPPPPMTAAVPVIDVTPATDPDDQRHAVGRLQKKQLSDSSLEIENSIYGMNPPPSESTSSSGVTSDSVSASGKNSKFELDDEWVDVADSTSDEFQEIILFRQKAKISDTTTHGWSIQVQKQLTKSYVSISSHSVISFVKDVVPEQLNRSRINQRDSLSEQLLQLTVVLKTVFLEEKFESQELSLFVDNEINEKKNIKDVPEEIYADYDSFESDDSWDDCYKNGEKLNRVPYPCENRDLPAPPSQQNAYGLVPLVKRAGNRMKKRWSLGSLGLSRIRKFSGNLTTDFGNRTYESTSDRCVDKKFNPSAKSLSSSIFYLNDPIYNNVKNGQVLCAPVRNASKPPSSIDSRRLSVARPSSPPPPPPASVKRHSTGNNTYGSLPRSICNSKGRPATNTESISENGSNQGSDHLYMRFADEPLYQFYAADLSERTKSVFAGDMMEECDGYEEISSITSRPSALELITPCPTGHGQHRSLWCEVPEVKNSGIIDALSPRERKLQEAKFELITSEASYFKSLTVLEKHFVNSHSMNDETILSKNDRKILFGNVNPVRKCSEKLLAALEKCWQDDILLKGLCEILYTNSKENFEIFVKYCSNQIYIDRTLKTLKEKNLKFNEALQRLESDSKCQSLSLHSFLMLPMQRITRLPLLVDAILSQMDSTENSLEYQMCELTLASLNSIVQNCNESTRKLERYEEMLLLSRQLEFSSKREMKAMSVASSSRWLVRSGSMLHLTSPDAKLTFSRKLIRPTKLYFFLFNDMFFIAKRKSDENYTVVDYCARNFVQMVDAAELVITSSYKNLLMLTILENHEAKTIEMLLSCDSESSKKRWIEAMSPPISSNPDETLYNEWDCPQVFAEHPYVAVQPDELSLQTGDIVKVLTKMNDGWYHGERIRDGVKGWFPGNYASEIASQHARSKNLKQRYRLLAMSGSYLQSQQDKIKKK